MICHDFADWRKITFAGILYHKQQSTGGIVRFSTDQSCLITARQRPSGLFSTARVKLKAGNSRLNHFGK
jgi:hypothetical protein